MTNPINKELLRGFRLVVAERRMPAPVERVDPAATDTTSPTDARMGKLREAKVWHADRPTTNGRIYPRKVMQRNIDRFKPLLKLGYLTGAVDHLGENEGGNLKRTPIIWRDLWMDADGAGFGSYQLVEQHSAGANLKSQLDAGMAVGFSTYGYGTGRPPTANERTWEWDLPDDTEVVVMDDFVLRKIDAVDDPAVHDARAIPMTEAVSLRTVFTEAYGR